MINELTIASEVMANSAGFAGRCCVVERIHTNTINTTNGQLNQSCLFPKLCCLAATLRKCRAATHTSSTVRPDPSSSGSRKPCHKVLKTSLGYCRYSMYSRLGRTSYCCRNGGVDSSMKVSNAMATNDQM